MRDKLRILVVCGQNKKRSRTAEYVFKNDSRFVIRSAGLSDQSERKLSESDLLWADLIFVMEDDQKRRIKSNFRHKDLPQIEVLQIEDIYAYLDEELIGLLTAGINNVLRINYGI